MKDLYRDNRSEGPQRHKRANFCHRSQTAPSVGCSLLPLLCVCNYPWACMPSKYCSVRLFLALTPLITDSYTPTHKQTDVHSTSPPGEMNKCSSVEKTTKDCQTVALEISFDHLSYENPNAKIRASRQMFCCVFSFLPVCGDICRAGLIEKALPSHSNSIACILCKRDDRRKIKKISK